MAVCNVCGKISDIESDLVLNKLFICKGMPSIICDNLCRICFYWFHNYFGLEPTQAFYSSEEWNQRSTLHAVRR